MDRSQGILAIERVFENRVLRIFGPKRAGVTGDWKKTA
jgi:hypothetical protein